MESLTPLVLEDISLPDFLRHVLDMHASSSTLVVCSSKDVFIKQLESAVSQDTADGEDNDGGATSTGQRHKNAWSVPTLRLLASSRTIKMVFCPDISHLKAYLGTYANRYSRDPDDVSNSASGSHNLLAILNPIQLHTPTSAFSAQGLNRTFATAVEAAHYTKSRLVMAECSIEGNATAPEDAQAALPTSLWNEDVSILNVTTKSFGAGERGWVGRTVKIRTIAGRWCTFERLPHNSG